MFPGTYDYCGWLTSALVMQNGGQYYNHDYGGEVFYDAPSAVGALMLLDKMVNQDKTMYRPACRAPMPCTTAFFAGRTGMMLLSTGSLSFVRSNMKLPYKVAFLPKSVLAAQLDRRVPR